MFDMSDASCRRGDCVMQVCLIPRAVMVKASSCFPVSLKDGSLGRESSEKNVAFKPIKFHDSPKKNISPETRNRERGKKTAFFLPFPRIILLHPHIIQHQIPRCLYDVETGCLLLCQAEGLIFGVFVASVLMWRFFCWWKTWMMGKTGKTQIFLGLFLELSSVLTNLCCFFFLFSAMSANGFGYGSAGGLWWTRSVALAGE